MSNVISLVVIFAEKTEIDATLYKSGTKLKYTQNFEWEGKFL